MDGKMAQFKVQHFDRNDPKNIGRASFFSIEDLVSIIEQYITADEVDTAKYLMKNLPGWYKDNVPIEIMNLRDQLARRFFTTLDYGKDGCTIAQIAAHPKEVHKLGAQLERGWLTSEAVGICIEAGHCPWIFELGPGNYWAPFMLRAIHGDKFNYFAPSLNQKMQEDASKEFEGYWKPTSFDNQKRIFICFEMIEHLAEPEEIYEHSVKAGGNFDVILLSTPKYTYGGGMPNWFESDLGHKRTYSPNEFTQFAQKHWPLYDWAYYDGPVMCLKGTRK